MNNILLYSGGLDSTTLLYEYQDLIKLCVYIDYGNANKQKELETVNYHCNLLNKPLEIIELRSVFSQLVRDNQHALLNANSTETNSYVFPFRNGIFASIIMSFAELNGYNGVYAGFCCGDDESDSEMTDTTHTFCSSMSIANGKVLLFAPYSLITKSRVLSKAMRLGIELNKTWSCYLSSSNPCGKCTACKNVNNSLYILNK